MRKVVFAFLGDAFTLLRKVDGKLTKLIAFEGIDACGKTLQHSLLLKALKTRGFSAAEKSFPEYERFFGERIADMLNGRGVRADEVDSKSMCLWFALDRWRAFKDAAWQSADYLIINRYTLSNAVYQSIRAIDSADMLDWVLELEHAQLGLPTPDAYIVLDVPEKTSDDNMEKRGGREYTSLRRDVYEQSEGIQSRARAKYAEYSKRLTNVILISAADESGMFAPERIHETILKNLEERGIL